MTGTAWHVGPLTGIVVLVALAAACAAPTSGGAPPTSPASPGGPVAPVASSSPAASGRGESGAVAAATAAAGGSAPSDSSRWPYAPAPSAEELKAQLERLAKDPGPIRTNWTPPGKTDRYGRAEGVIAAPYDVVKARLLDFAHYQELAGPKFKKVSVVDKSAAGTDLYFQLPIMKGVVTIWYVTRFSSSRPGMNGAEIIEGKFVKGNIKDMQIVFTLRPGPEQKTILVCDLNLSINLPAPQELLDEELRDACGDAVNAVRARTTRPPAPPPAPSPP